MATEFNSGWIKIYRQLTEWQWYHSTNHVRLFLHLLLKATHKKITIGKQELFPGELITGRNSLSNDTGLSIMQIRTVLSDLKATSEITIKTYSKYSIISISNWVDFQEDNQQNNQQITSKQPADNHIQECKELKNKELNTNVFNNIYMGNSEKKSKKFVKPTLEEIKAYVKEQKYSFDPEKFFNHYESANWFRGKTKIQNWKLCCSTWQKNTNEFEKSNIKEGYKAPKINPGEEADEYKHLFKS